MRKTKYVLGADPGKTGGIVLIPTSGPLNNDTVILIPTKVIKFFKDKTKVCTSSILAGLSNKATSIIACTIENIHALGGTASGSTFEFGDAYGVMRGCLETLFSLKNNKEVKYLYPTPKVWQKVCWEECDLVNNVVYSDKAKTEPVVLKNGSTKTKIDTKATSLNAAKRLMPDVSFLIGKRTKPHDGLVDAALIAYYGRLEIKA